MAKMPKVPGVSGNSRRKEGFSISGILDEWKENMVRKQEEAARNLTNDVARNRECLIATLKSADFFKTRLPQAVLDDKYEKTDKLCKLEILRDKLIRELENYTKYTELDIRPIDANLLALADLFATAVALGQTQTAYVTIAALRRGIVEIRCQIPEAPQEQLQLFVEQNAEHLARWIVVAESAKRVDDMKSNLVTQKTNYETHKKQQEENIAASAKDIKENLEYREAYAQMADPEHPFPRKDWQEIHWEVQKILVDCAFRRTVLAAELRRVNQLDLEICACMNEIDLLKTELNERVSVTDPNLLGKQKEILDDLMKRMAESEVYIQEKLKGNEEIQFGITQLDDGVAAVKLAEAAQREALKQIREREKAFQVRTSANSARQKELQKKLAIYTPEEEAAIKQLNEERAKEIEAGEKAIEALEAPVTEIVREQILEGE